MKSTGVTRKIDELGRIVIPKEIRKNLGIRDGEYLEIFTDEDAIILKKYFEVKKLEDICLNLCNLVNSIFDVGVIITDREKVIATSLKEGIMGKRINQWCMDLIDERETYVGDKVDTLDFQNIRLSGYYTVVPLINSSDSIGLVMILSKEEQNYLNIAKLITSLVLDTVDI